jgi:hypothetical protein
VSCIASIVVIFLIGFVAGINADEGSFQTSIAFVAISTIFFGVPFLLWFLVLNIWGFMKRKSFRWGYGVLVLPLTVLIGWCIYKCFTMPLL